MPYKNAETRRQYIRAYMRTPRGRELRNANVRRFRLRHPEMVIRIKLRQNFGLTIEQYADMLSEQDGVCAICHGINASGRRLAVDHDHVTGKIRGLLCSQCNTSLGHYEKIKDKAQSYLHKG
jgi:DNA-binding transcriptional MerR regulator